MKTTFKNNGSRHPAVVNFSREHHFGLVFCRHMKRLIESKSDIDHIRLLFGLFWSNELQQHTESEEAFAQTLSHVPAIDQMNSDHRRLESMFNECDDYSFEELSELATLLEEHIRFEEKILFPRIPALLKKGA